MRRYLVRRLLHALVVLFLLSIIVFVIARLSGSPADVMLPIDAKPAERAAVTHRFGLDRPWPIQYWKFVRHAVHGDFGTSTRFQAPALRLVIDRAPASIELALAAVFLALLIGIPLGVVAALKRGTAVDHAATAVTAVAQATPTFWLGIVLILWFGVSLHVLPLSGKNGISSFILPAVTLCVVPLVGIARLTRSSVISVLPQDYVRAARAKGLHERSVVWRYVLRNALLPIVTITGITLGQLLSGAVIVEQIFAWPGIGRLAIDAIQARDYPVVQTVTIVSASLFIVINIVVDLVYMRLDPRIRQRMLART
ncbi:MAG TPA: ABC transporter permease [Gaiellaceae bacterium]|nr:ABC transporter permease [Gaiellaceae bacterium]